MMKPFCEVMVQEVLPAIRGIVANQLTRKYGMSQKRAAFLLGLSQPAISQYRRELRGYRADMIKGSDKLADMVAKLAEGLASGEIRDYESTLRLCHICKEMRKSGLACKMHRERDPSLESCSVCMYQENSR